MLKQFKPILNLIISAYKQGKSRLIIKKNGYFTPVLNLITANGFIKSFQEFNNLLVINLRMHQIKGEPLNSISKVSYTTYFRRKSTIEYKNLLKLQRREGLTSLYIINTDKGLINSSEAITKKIGGKILFKLA